MAKKKTAKAPTAKRIDVSEYGIDLSKLLGEIMQQFDGKTRAEIGEAAGLPAQSVTNYVNGVKPSLGALAALADAAGGRIVVTFEPPQRKQALKRKK